MSILIVDDESEILKTLKAHFELEGIPVTTAGSAAEGLELHRKNLYPVVLTDIRMPGMGGVEFIREVKRVHTTCLVFAMTGYASLASMIECLEVGVSDYLMKPFDSLSLVTETVSEGLRKHERWMKDLRGLRKKPA